MAESDFRLPGINAPLSSPEFYVSRVLRNFGVASQALGRATETLVVRLAPADNGADPDYQIETLDGEDAAAFSGDTHDLINQDITVLIDPERLQQGQQYTAEQVKDWLNALNGEGSGGGPLNPILSDRWKEAEASDPRD